MQLESANLVSLLQKGLHFTRCVDDNGDTNNNIIDDNNSDNYIDNNINVKF